MIVAILSLLIISVATTHPVSIGTPLTKTATKILMLGGGELGKGVVIEAQKFGAECVVVDRYANAPAMQVAHRSYVINMLDGAAIRAIVEKEQHDLIVPEIEAIATETLLELEKEGYKVIPTARAAYITMNRERIRRLAAEELGLKTSKYLFAQEYEDYCTAIKAIGIPCVVKPIMSSSGKGQTIIRASEQIELAWNYAQTGSRTGQPTKVIVEEFIPFDYEVTILTVRHRNQTSFCEPIGHLQIDGDYRESWQPHPMTQAALAEAQHIAKTITDALGGTGIFGVELFIKGDDVYFSEVSPRPHDTGMVTIISQNLSEFALHARAILDLPIPNIVQFGPSASCALLVHGDSDCVTFGNLENALDESNTQVQFFGKPEVHGHRRMGVALAQADTIALAREKARTITERIKVTL